MRRPTKPVRKRPADAVPRLHQDARTGLWHWKPSPNLRPTWTNVALGRHKEPARAEARRLNREAEAWLARQAESRPPRPRLRTGPATVGQVIEAYKASTAWLKLRPRTQAQYRYELGRLAEEFAHDVAPTLSRVRVHEWLEDLSFRAPETARHVAARGRGVFTWAIKTGAVVRIDNPFDRAGLTGGRKRRFRFTWPDVLHLLAVAEGRVVKEGTDPIVRPSVAVALAIGYATVQRISDVIALHDGLLVADPDGTRLVFDQSKRIKVRARGELEALFRVDMALPPIVADLLARHPPTLCRREGEPEAAARRYWIVSEETGAPYHEKTIARVFGRLVKAAIAVDPKRWKHLAGGQLRDGRRSGFVHRVVEGQDVPSICAVSGHSLDEGFGIVEHYLPPTRELADKGKAFMTARL